MDIKNVSEDIRADLGQIGSIFDSLIDMNNIELR